MNEDKKQKILELTNARKVQERKVNKIGGRLRRLRYWTGCIDFTHATRDAVLICVIASLIGIGGLIIGGICSAVCCGVGIAAVIGSGFLHNYWRWSLMDKVEAEHDYECEKLKQIKKQLECVRENKVYEATPITKRKTGSELESEACLELAKMMSEARQKRVESALEKAKSQDIDVDRIKLGPDAYSSKKEYKEAKQELDDYLEELGL